MKRFKVRQILHFMKRGAEMTKYQTENIPLRDIPITSWQEGTLRFWLAGSHVSTNLNLPKSLHGAER